MDRFERDLERVARELYSAPFPADEIERDIDRTLSTTGSGKHSGRQRKPSLRDRVRLARNAVLAVAASVAVFLAGIAYGRVSLVAGEKEAAGGPKEMGTMPYEIQSAGSEYVVSLARFARVRDTLQPTEQQKAREVAFAILYGATLELMKQAEDDDVLRAVAQLVSSEVVRMSPQRTEGLDF